jgi:hypothetical protein
VPCGSKKSEIRGTTESAIDGAAPADGAAPVVSAVFFLLCAGAQAIPKTFFRIVPARLLSEQNIQQRRTELLLGAFIFDMTTMS